ncbi:hypothetical protein [Sediminispirochaeta bajacaliforniensis]|uniref:hypothetical protein n=1 Tax=Sediminispirochaeta bajacaliforniensis TaxID=148 RepID=UPI00037F746A|nr:hypothetical protein [Sediminispirochaeta bajacaliforniensis]
MNDDTDKMLRELEEQNGGKIRYKTYALFLGKSGGGEQDLGGLFYGIEDRLIFEDFERPPNMLLALFNTKKPEYTKYKVEFSPSEITGVRAVVMGQVKAAVTGRIPPERVAESTGLRKMLGRSAVEIRLNDGKAFYFELFDIKGFIRHMKELV